MARNQPTSNQSGWTVFVSYLLVLAGFFQSVLGLVAVYRPDIFAAGTKHLFLSDYNQWGWTHFAIGIFLIISAYFMFKGHLWGRIVAVVWATLSAIVNFSFIWAAPVWSILIIALDVSVVYGIAMHGGTKDGES